MITPVPDSIEEITPGVTVEWFANRRIVAYTVRTTARQAIDIYGKYMLKVLNDWPADQTYLTLQDFAEPSMSFTPLLRKYVDDVLVARLDIVHYTSLLMPPTFLAQLAKAFIHLRNKPGKVETNLSPSRSAGLAWLWTKLPAGEDLAQNLEKERKAGG